MNPKKSNRLSKTACAILGVLAFTLAAFLPSAAMAGGLHHWVQYAERGWEARAVTNGKDCPKASIDGHEALMNPRTRPNESFPVLICSLKIPDGAKKAKIDGRSLALPPPRIDKILLIGDTGCRLKALYMQECNAIAAWPFRLNAELGAKLSPDLVIHLGDYYYRERACPALFKGCAGSPWGDNWETWRADFFEPARALLSSAPWVFTRGNHESCERGGRGWTRALDAFPYPTEGECIPRDAPFSVDLGGLTLFVLDTADVDDRVADAERVKYFETQFARAGAISGPAWFAFHRPVFAVARLLGPFAVGGNETLAQAARNAMPANAQAILSGHIHAFQAMDFNGAYPAQIVAGNGGVALDYFTPSNFDGLEIKGATVERGRGIARAFGFAMLERSEGEWRLSAYETNGKILTRCGLRGRKLDCE